MPAVRPASPAEGVSVVLPVYRGEAEVGACLASLAAQTLDPALFEIIVVINGEPDATAAILADFRLRHPKLDIRVVTTRKPGAGRARNAGLAAARFSFTTFIDHDDYVSPSFLKSLVGFPPRESNKILEILWEHVVRPEYTVRFKWNPGDIAFWDNRSTAHLAPRDIFESEFDRQLYRITLVGQPLVGVDGKPSRSIEGFPILSAAEELRTMAAAE